MYCIFTNNDFGQILIFDSYEKAVNWCKRATRWNDKEISENIKSAKATHIDGCITFFNK